MSQHKRRRKRHLKSWVRYTLCLIIFLTIIIIYGLWPRNYAKAIEPIPFQSVSPVFISQPIEFPATSWHDFQMNFSEERQISIHQTEEQTPDKEPQNEAQKYIVTEEEYDLLARLIFCEANTEPIEAQIAVVQVVFNRLFHPNYPNTIEGVIYQKHQFSPAGTRWMRDAKPTETNYEALDRALAGEEVVPSNVIYFWGKSLKVHKGSWRYKLIEKNGSIVIGDLTFCGE